MNISAQLCERPELVVKKCCLIILLAAGGMATPAGVASGRFCYLADSKFA